MYFITVGAVGEEKASRGGGVLDLEEGPEKSLGGQRGGGTWTGRQTVRMGWRRDHRGSGERRQR